MTEQLEFSLKVILPCGTRFGRGKAELMQHIDALGRQLGSLQAQVSRINAVEQ